jgi:hypothetical protein
MERDPEMRLHWRFKCPKQALLPVTASLAAKLLRAAGDRPASDPLLLKSDGSPWRPKNSDQRQPFATIAAQVGLPGQGKGNQLQWVVDLLRSREVSWAQIGDALGISRQTAWERFT